MSNIQSQPHLPAHEVKKSPSAFFWTRNGIKNECNCSELVPLPSTQFENVATCKHRTFYRRFRLANTVQLATFSASFFAYRSRNLEKQTPCRPGDAGDQGLFHVAKSEYRQRFSKNQCVILPCETITNKTVHAKRGDMCTRYSMYRFHSAGDRHSHDPTRKPFRAKICQLSFNARTKPQSAIQPTMTNTRNKVQYEY